MATINLFVIGFGRPDLLREQKRLLDKYLKDPFEVCVVDNTVGIDRLDMERVCRESGFGYRGAISPKCMHNEALNTAAQLAHDAQCDYWGVLDHDVFPRRTTRLIRDIKPAGFFGVGQFHTPTNSRYLWPGFAFFSRKWLNGRVPNFDGIRAIDRRDDGDCGSMLAGLFNESDWLALPRFEHGYKVIRPEDGYGLQSYGIEFFGDWLHLTNASHWMEIPDKDGRDTILREMVAAL